jgi:nucleotide-binding universal stress UspA family protein
VNQSHLTGKESIMTASTHARSVPLLPHKVLIAVDACAASQHALAYARAFVAARGEVRLVSVAQNPRSLIPMGSFVAGELDAARAELSHDAQEALAKAREAFAGSDIRVETEEIDLSVSGGDVVHALIDAAQRWGADLIVVGARQHHGLMRWIEGAVSGPVARLSQCPILVVPAGFAGAADRLPDRLPERVLFAVDGSPHATRAVKYGARFVTGDTALRALYVIDRAAHWSDMVPIDVLEDAFVQEGEQALAAAKASLDEVSARASTRLSKTARSGDDIAQTIVREADSWNAKLIVMGTHGRRGVARWMLGSVAERVVRLARTPVLLVHASEP